MRAAALILSLLIVPLAAAYPDPAGAPVYYDSECFAQHGKRFVHDYIDVLPARYGVELEGAACEVYAATSAHYVIVTVPDSEGESLENYALHLFESWGIGDKERNDGLLLLYVKDYLGSGSGALRIEVGYGLEGVVNSRVSNEAFDIMIETRDEAEARGDSSDEARALALAAGSAYLLETVKNGYTDAGFPPSTLAAPSGRAPLQFWLIVGFVVFVLIVSLARDADTNGPGGRGWGHRQNSDAWVGGAFAGALMRTATGPRRPGGGMGGGGLGGGGSGSFGGGSFGGGRSGGGGRGGRF